MVCRASAIAAVRLLSVATLPPVLRPRTNVETIFVGPPRRMHWGHRASSLSAPPAPAPARRLRRRCEGGAALARHSPKSYWKRFSRSMEARERLAACRPARVPSAAHPRARARALGRELLGRVRRLPLARLRHRRREGSEVPCARRQVLQRTRPRCCCASPWLRLPPATPAVRQYGLSCLPIRCGLEPRPPWERLRAQSCRLRRTSLRRCRLWSQGLQPR